MKLGVAGRIVILDVDLDDTVDVRITYSDIVAMLESPWADKDTEALAGLYLNHIGE